MRKILLCFVLFWMGTMCVSAQTDNYDASVKKMLLVSGGAETFKVVVPQMISMMKAQLPDVPASYWDEVQSEFSKAAFDELVALLVPVYKKHLSQQDIEAVIKFYETPAGKKMAAASPQISSESMQIGQQWGMQLAGKIQNKLKEKGYIK